MTSVLFLSSEARGVPNMVGANVPQLTPAQPRQMLGEALRYVRSLPRDLDQRADAFEALARHIEKHTGGAWNAARGSGIDGSAIFLGRQGEALVVATDGRLYRGGLGRGSESRRGDSSPTTIH